MKFEWDENKCQKVVSIHSVDFRDVAAHRLMGLPRSFRSDQNGEEFYVGIAQFKGQQWAFIYTLPEDSVRIISARKWKQKVQRKVGELHR